MSLVECIQDQGPYYRKLKAELDSESSVEKELSATKARRQEIENEINTTRAQINSLEQQSKKEFKDVRKLRNLSFRSAAATLSGKKKEKIVKEEAKYQLAFENEQRSKRKLEELQIEYNKLISKEATLVEQKTHFIETREQYNSLIEQIFQIEDPDFPLEPQLKAELRNYIEQSRLATRDKHRFAEAETALTSSLVDIKKVIRVLDTVINYVPFEIFGGPIIDEEQISYLEIARKKIWSVQRLLNTARTILPEIPYPHLLDVVTNNPLLSMQINLNYVDIAWKTKTSQCFGMLAAVYRNAQNSINWVRQYKNYAIDAVKRLDTAIEVVKASLCKERIRIIDAVLSGQYPSNAEEELASYEAPPPVYEAPPSHEGAPPAVDLPPVPSPIESDRLSLNDLTSINTNQLPHYSQDSHTQDSHTQANHTSNESYISHNANNPFQAK